MGDLTDDIGVNGLKLKHVHSDRLVITGEYASGINSPSNTCGGPAGFVKYVSFQDSGDARQFQGSTHSYGMKTAALR